MPSDTIIPTLPWALPRVIGHRGAARHAPENTLASIRMAASQGAPWVEVDVKLTADMIPVVMHDEALDRTTNAKGAVRDLTLAELRRLDAGSWFSPAFRGERVPTLEEVIALTGALGLGLNLEIKPCPGREEETAGVALTLAHALWPEDRPPPLVSSFTDACLATAALVTPAWPRGLLFEQRPRDWLDRARAVRAATINVNARKEDGAGVAALRAAGYPVLAYTVNSPPAAREVWGWGVAGVFTDTPQTLLAGAPAP